jgi:hypothetical protein
MKSEPEILNSIMASVRALLRQHQPFASMSRFELELLTGDLERDLIEDVARYADECASEAIAQAEMDREMAAEFAAYEKKQQRQQRRKRRSQAPGGEAAQ